LTASIACADFIEGSKVAYLARMCVPKLVKMVLILGGRGVYPILINYRKEKDRILTVANQLHEMHLVDDEETVLFTEGCENHYGARQQLDRDT
jgi:hypothetical protein